MKKNREEFNRMEYVIGLIIIVTLVIGVNFINKKLNLWDFDSWAWFVISAVFVGVTSGLIQEYFKKIRHKNKE